MQPQPPNNSMGITQTNAYCVFFNTRMRCLNIENRSVAKHLNTCISPLSIALVSNRIMSNLSPCLSP